MRMEIVQNRYGHDRVIEKLSTNKIRIMGESLVVRSSKDEFGNYTMFDFEGGPVLTIGGKIRFGKMDWVIESIHLEDSDRENIVSVICGIKF